MSNEDAREGTPELDESGVRGVVLAHGPMARAMVDAVRRIAGDKADAVVA